MATKRVRTDAGEVNRRTIVQDIAARGSAALQRTQQTPDRAAEFAAAAKASAAADPVDFSAAQQASLATPAATTAGREQAFASAASAASAASDTRQTSAFNTFFDSLQQDTASGNVLLDQQEADAIQAAADRKAQNKGPATQQTAPTSQTYPIDPTDNIQVSIEQIFQDKLAEGGSWGSARRDTLRLLEGIGWSREDALTWIEYFSNRWADQFPNTDPMARENTLFPEAPPQIHPNVRRSTHSPQILPPAQTFSPERARAQSARGGPAGT